MAANIVVDPITERVVDDTSARHKLVRVAQAGEPWTPPVLEARISYYEHRSYFYLLRTDGSVWHIKPRKEFKYKSQKPSIVELLQGDPVQRSICDKIEVASGIETVSPMLLQGTVSSTTPINQRAQDVLRQCVNDVNAYAAPRGDCVLTLYLFNPKQ